MAEPRLFVLEKSGQNTTSVSNAVVSRVSVKRMAAMEMCYPVSLLERMSHAAESCTVSRQIPAVSAFSIHICV